MKFFFTFSECLVYLCYKDAFQALHKYMYLPEHNVKCKKAESKNTDNKNTDNKNVESSNVEFDDSTRPQKHSRKRLVGYNLQEAPLYVISLGLINWKRELGQCYHLYCADKVWLQ